MNAMMLLILGPGYKNLLPWQLMLRVCYFIAALYLSWLVYRDLFISPVEILAYEISTPKVRPGQTVDRRVCVIRHRVCDTDPDILIIADNGDRLHVSSSPISSPGPIHVLDCYTSSTYLPTVAGGGLKAMTPGRAEMRVAVTYSCSPLHRAIGPYKITMPPLHFEVLP